MRPAGTRQFVGIMDTQPVDKFSYIIIAPHPGWKAGESSPFGGRRIEVPHKMINACSIGPVSPQSRRNVKVLFDNEVSRVIRLRIL